MDATGQATARQSLRQMLDAIGRCLFWKGNLTTFTFIVGHEAFEVTDSYGGFVHLEVDTLAFALLFLRTYTTTYSGELL